MLNTMI